VDEDLDARNTSAGTDLAGRDNVLLRPDLGDP
jgi:hypothetical protein